MRGNKPHLFALDERAVPSSVARHGSGRRQVRDIGPAQAVPVLDLPPRSGLRSQGDRDPGPLPGVLPGQAAAAGRPDPVGDAKPSIQARGRCHPTAPAAPGKPVRVEHEYVRHGALALLAALDVHTGKVFASTPATTEASRCPASWVRPRAQSASRSDGVNASASSRPDTTRGNRGYAVRSTDVTRNSRDRNQPDAANLNDQASAAARFCRIPADPVMAVQLACGDRGNDVVRRRRRS